MPRQLQGSYAPFPGTRKVIPVSGGGTGASTPEQAAQNLGGIHKSRYNVPGGIVQADEAGLLPSWALLKGGIAVGYSIDGPLSLVQGQTSVYTITNYNSLSPAQASVDHGSVTVSGDQVSITAPTDQTQVTLTLGARTIVIPVLPFGPVQPVFTTLEGSTQKRNFVLSVAPYHSEPENKGSWIPVTTSGTSVSVPANASVLEIMGRSGTTGTCYAQLGSTQYKLNTSTIVRRIELTGQASAIFVFSGDGNLSYRFVTPSSVHVSTDWQIASDPNFINIVLQSLADTVNKTTWPVYLPPGKYYARARMLGQLS